MGDGQAIDIGWPHRSAKVAVDVKQVQRKIRWDDEVLAGVRRRFSQTSTLGDQWSRVVQHEISISWHSRHYSDKSVCRDVHFEHHVNSMIGERWIRRFLIYFTVGVQWAVANEIGGAVAAGERDRLPVWKDGCFK